MAMMPRLTPRWREEKRREKEDAEEREKHRGPVERNESWHRGEKRLRSSIRRFRGAAKLEGKLVHGPTDAAVIHHCTSAGTGNVNPADSAITRPMWAHGNSRTAKDFEMSPKENFGLKGRALKRGE
ncbi:hypothetical protein KM043_004148 [Ampulex compressa]|nr:hypothetical protein KM043_004148 [Ampulex compressa]